MKKGLPRIGCCGRTQIGATGDYLQIGILALLGVGGYFLFKKLSSGTLTAGGQNNAGINTSSAASAASDLAAVTAKGVKQALSDTTLNGYATTLYQLLGSSGGPPLSPTDFTNFYTILTNIQNDADWYRMVQLFGTKQFNSGSWISMCAVSGGLVGCDSYDLPAAMRAALGPDQIGVVNNYFLYQTMGAKI